jgi:lipid-A-disaccharide synthase-like uncharacterized protein
MGSNAVEGLWLAIGAAGQILFTARFVVQWAVSEKKRDSVVPVAFWWLSLLGGLTLLSYVIYRRDPVLIVGQSMGVVVYVRNLMLVSKAKKRVERKRRRDQALAAAAESQTLRIDPAARASVRT